ncbi:Mtc5p [Aspergillus saccharolyticus JOP 1030-1]|uniref:RING-type domain-containing protein n=1 Tax=Aspergillus saccharolyticus JOP 1030-1 TaxID=1450539 RepID=A0A318ZDF2_9EURO|nr:hypothetical protein BP01DRAFT_356872 [Aspergillus saccharolyticus JOP 1030-1]PYH45369.1 hypothetical protein BP01DRAFT_356872 [Aspergillus saccharolyticus JOP 1030-1]
MSEPRPPGSAHESPTFGEDSSFHVEQPVGSMSISPCGRDVVLASKEGLHVIDLDSPYSPPRYLPHHTPWEVADVQWSPFAARDYWVASTSNQKALVWNLGMKTSESSIEHVLHAHTRAITDINFSAHHPDMLATCAVDSFVHCWDLRITSRPAISFSDWLAGATQVKWNRQDPNVIASSHDKFLRIWDKRKGAYPITSIQAHDTKIYGVDWNRVRPGALTTCSLDRTIKFWDYTVNTEVPEKIIRAPFPVWRARNTPFGWGVLAMPQRGNSDLHLYSRRLGEGANPGEDLPLVHSFPGHKGQVKEFLWRARGGTADGIDHREFQLVSWGTDRELRLHRVDPDILQRVGYEKGKSFISNYNLTRKDTGSLSPKTQQSATPQASRNKGLNTISIPYARGWTQSGGNPDSRIGMQGRTNVRADTNPIAWMRGVKISGWDIETLGDEITHVGEKFTKVAFESVDVRQRKAMISLHGPWGADGDSLFLKVDIKFPSDYPRTSVPTFSVQKTAAVTDDLADKLVAETRKIAETYLSHKRGCLEGVLRYLLGESTLEESMAWLSGETAETVKSPINSQLEGEESSDEDEVGLSQSQDLGMSSELLRPVNANVMVPVAKACGALWANDGRLVCFFPSKNEKSADWIENLGLREMSRLSRTDKVFEGFGRLQTSSPGPRPSGTIASTDDGASEYSDDSDAESSSSSGSSGILSGLQHRFPTPQTWRSGGSLGIYRPRSTDNSQRSTAGATATKASDPPQNVVSIHDFSDLLPAKRELAVGYRICGKVTDVCAHNSAVALDHGYHELARIWGLLRLILHNRKTSMLASNLDLLGRSSRIQRKDSAIDLTFDAKGHDRGSKAPHGPSIRWGDHPFGSHWLIPSILEHFERIGDIQMIAMLSCVLHEPSNEEISVKEKVQHSRSVSKRMEEHSFSFDFYPPHTVIHNRSHTATPLATTPKDSHTTPKTHGSGRSSSEIWRVDSTPPHSTGTTPPSNSRVAALPADRKAWSQNVSIAASPDQQSQPRSASGLGSVLASSLSRSFTFGPSSASPPPTALSKKKQSPNGSLHTTGGSGMWVTSALAAKPASAIPDYLTTSTALTSQTHSDTESERALPTKPRPKLQTTFKNQNAFDSGSSHNTFLDPKKECLYRSYRAAYAHLLSIWALPVQRSEVLKIGGVAHPLRDLHVPHQRPNGHHDSFSFPISKHREATAVPIDVDRGLDIQLHCNKCGQALQHSIFATKAAVEAVASRSHMKGASSSTVTCPNCTPKHSLALKLPCVICSEVVEGMLIPCLGCGHVSCFDCHRGWFSMASADAHHEQDAGAREEYRYCPSGCGCKCSDFIDPDSTAPWDVTTDIPTPQEREGPHTRHRSKKSDGSVSIKHAVEPAPATSYAPNGDDTDQSPSVSPFASLAKGLGGGLSRGLRLRDDRRRSKLSATSFVPKKSSMNQVENR